MSERNLWRGIALVASLGWATTALWASLSPSAPDPHSPPVEATAEAPRVLPRPLSPVTWSQPGARALPEHLHATPTLTTLDLVELRDEIRAEVEAELAEERWARHEEHRARHLDRMLHDVEAFTQANDLSSSVQIELETAVLAMHDRTAELGPPDRSEEGPPPEVREILRGSLEQLDQDVHAVLGEDLTDAFHEWMRPRPPGMP